MKTLMMLLLLTIVAPLTAEIIFYRFDDPAKEERFNRLIEDLRCPKCQNNNLADSNAPLSVDLKDIIYTQINDGKTDEEIIDYLKQRYGDFIYYKPPIKPSTWIIWFGPFALLIIGGLFIYRAILAKKPKQASTDVSDANLKLVEEWQKESQS